MSLFARSFLLIALLVVASLSVWFAILRSYQREPLAAELSKQVVSTVNLTRAALINADPERRLRLLRELSDMEGIRVYGAAPGEDLQPLPHDALLDRVAQLVRLVLGERTRLAWARDGADGFWVSFFIDEDEFWILLPRERVRPDVTWEWVGWGTLTVLLSLAAAWLIASRLAGPLSDLAAAARLVGKGLTPEPLAEKGPKELRTVAAAFNRMTGELAVLERQRAVVLAGISHDLRTPLSRLRLALEMSEGDPAIAGGMSADIDEIDQVIGQFLDFARGDTDRREPTDLEALTREVAEHFCRLGKDVRTTSLQACGDVRLMRPAVRRALINLVDNALRYAGEPVEISIGRSESHVLIDVLDRGPGIPADEVERLKRPFTRLSESRGAHGGAGLGLAIVERVARAHGGSLHLVSRQGGGLLARLSFPLSSA